MPSISGQSILVIGGSSGIGFAVAKLALAENVQVAIASSSTTKVNDAVSRLRSSFPNASITGHTCDLSQDDQEARLSRLLTAASAAGPLDHIIITAGRPIVKPFAEIDKAYILQSAQLMLVTSFLLAKLAPRFLKQAYTSSLVFTTGRVAERPIPGYGVYAAYAAGVHALVRNLAIDFPPVRFNVVAPGATDTEMWGEGERREKYREFAKKTALLGKPGSAEEVGEAYIYLMKDSNATGTVIRTDGGATIQ